MTNLRFSARRRAIQMAALAAMATPVLTACDIALSPSKPRPDLAIAPLIIGAIFIGFGWSAGKPGDDDAGKAPEGLPAHRSPRGPAAGALRMKARISDGGGNVWHWAALLFGSVVVLTAFPKLDRPLWLGGAVVLTAVLGWLSRYDDADDKLALAGYELADARWIDSATAAERAGQAIPAEPELSHDEAIALGKTGGFTAPVGSAAEVMLDIDGKDGPIRSAWRRVAEALDLGAPDDAGNFTPLASVDHVATSENGDVTVYWELAGIQHTASSISRALPPLIRELKVKDAPGGVLTDHSTGLVYARFSNVGGAAGAKPQAAPAPQKPAEERWEF